MSHASSIHATAPSGSGIGWVGQVLTGHDPCSFVLFSVLQQVPRLPRRSQQGQARPDVDPTHGESREKEAFVFRKMKGVFLTKVVNISRF
jgi:hypothetical protein